MELRSLGIEFYYYSVLISCFYENEDGLIVIFLKVNFMCFCLAWNLNDNNYRRIEGLIFYLRLGG